MFLPDSFRAARWLRSCNLLLQALLFVSLFSGLNYLARSYAWRFDLTAQQRHSLSPETRAYLAGLQRPVRIVVTLSESDENPEIAQAYRDLRGLLREYSYASQNNPNGPITAEFIDIYRQHHIAGQLGLAEPNTVLLLCGEARQQVALSDLYGVSERERKDFRGEQALTAAILSVSNPARKKIYFLTGNGELRPDDVDPTRGLSSLASELKRRNYSIDLLALPARAGVPEDADLVIAATPQGRYDPHTQEQLRDYLSLRVGRLIVLCAPGIAHGLDDLFYDWGILVDDVLVRDSATSSYTDNGDLIVRHFAPHPITRTLIDYRLRPDPGRSIGGGLEVSVLAATAPTAWGEISYRQRGTMEYNPGIDLKGQPEFAPKDRLGLVAASERVQARGNLPFSVRSGRLVVIGTGDLVANHRIATPGNQSLFLNAVKWSIDRDAQLNIPPRPIERFQLSLDQRELLKLRSLLVFALPLATAALGLIVYWSRRN